MAYVNVTAVMLCIVVVLAPMTTARTTPIYNITINVNGMTNTTSVQVDAGTTVVVTCQVMYNGTRAPTIQFKKTFNATLEEIAVNDHLMDNVYEYGNNRYSAIYLDETPLLGTDIYQYSIIDAVAADSGHYCCSGDTYASITVSLNVTVEPTSVTLYIDNETVSQSSTSYKKTMIVGQNYTLRCVAAGGNPFPNVALSTGSTPISLTASNYMTYKTKDSFPGTLSRSTEIVARWQMTQHSIGVPIVCTTAAKSVNATNTSVSFIPIADNGGDLSSVDSASSTTTTVAIGVQSNMSFAVVPDTAATMARNEFSNDTTTNTTTTNTTIMATTNTPNTNNSNTTNIPTTTIMAITNNRTTNNSATTTTQTATIMAATNTTITTDSITTTTPATTIMATAVLSTMTTDNTATTSEPDSGTTAGCSGGGGGGFDGTSFVGGMFLAFGVVVIFAIAIRCIRKRRTVVEYSQF